jgi:hypothetical protein
MLTSHHHPIFQLLSSSFKDDVTAILLLDVSFLVRTDEIFGSENIEFFVFAISSEFSWISTKNVFVSTLV